MIESRKIIHSSHLALRFYKSSWSKEELEPYLTRGQIIDQREGREQRDYFWLDHTRSSSLDMRRLYEVFTPRVFTYEWLGDGYRELSGEAAIAYMSRMNCS